MRRAASELASFPSFRDRLHGLVRPCTILPLEALWDLYSFLWHDVPSETAFRGRLEGEHRECCTRKDGKRTYKVNAWREPVRRLAVEEARERSPPKGGGYKGVVVHERRAGATAAEVLAALADAEAVAEDGDAAFQPLAEDDAPPSEVPSLRDNGSFASDGDVLTSDSGGGLLPHDRPPSEPAPLQEDGAPMGQATDAADSVDGGPAGELELAWMRVTAMTAVLELEDFDEAVWRYWDLAPGRPARVEQMS
ncbi:hypothetical protein DFJ74DRAFT_661514 [Hyaloraphidium curvatum]|nr:hypothetical protein DFJ74DRAFT_661514 [Hyaloraphidium curvatum]